MIEVPGEIVEVAGDRVLVRAKSRGGGCGRCDQPGGCGSAKITGALRSPELDVWLANDIGAAVGDAVLVCMADDAPLRAALIAYMVPVAGIVLGAAAGVVFAGASDLHALLGAAAGLLLGLLLGRRLSRGSHQVTEPFLRPRDASQC